MRAKTQENQIDGPQVPVGARSSTLVRNLVHLTIAFVAAVAALPGSAVASAAPAPAATCTGSSCRGLDPASTSCAGDAVTIKAGDYKAESSASFRIEVRYSSSCNAAWGRLIVYSGFNVGFALSAWNPNTPSVGAVGHDGNTTWTAMIDGSLLDCAGSHFYVNSQWVRWYYVGCA